MKDDKELFDLCMQVYEATKWIVSEYPNDWYMQQRVSGRAAMARVHPLYTSDYLLEKLPRRVDESDLLCIEPSWDGKGWNARYSKTPRNVASEFGSTPVISLLKLTLALHEAGVLKSQRQSLTEGEG